MAADPVHGNGQGSRECGGGEQIEKQWKRRQRSKVSAGGNYAGLYRS